MTIAIKPIPHGILTTAKHHNCSCPDCRAAERRYENNRYRQIAYGTWQPYIDAQPARQHIRTLQAAGIGWERIAAAAGLATSTVERLLYGKPAEGEPPCARIRPATAAAILAVKPDPKLLAEGARVDATGTRRRLQALAAAGYPNTFLAPELGILHTYVSHLRARPRVFLRTARAVAALYERFAHVDPASVGVPAASVRRACLAAERKGWLPPSAWDTDIDDPAADPKQPDSGVLDQEAVQRILDGDTANLSRPERIEAARLLHLTQGLSLAETARRVGVAGRTVLRWKQAGWQVAA